jgi:hypothetical protein
MLRVARTAMGAAIGASVALAPCLPAAAAPLDTQRIEKLTGQKGKLNDKKDVFKVSYPRADLHVMAAGVAITPPFGTTSWAAFTPAGNGAMVMGDLVLTEDQVNPVMSAALDNGLDVTALHNHFFGDAPKVMFMHIGGMGDQAKLAGAVGKVFATIKATAGHPGTLAPAAIAPGQTTLDAKALEGIIGAKGELTKGVFKITIGRTTRMGDHEVGKDMGVNTWAAFMGSTARAVVDGDFAMTEQEVRPVLVALRHAGINIVAIHNHMLGEQPRIIFLHFWGVGPATMLAKGIKAALDQTHP